MVSSRLDRIVDMHSSLDTRHSTLKAPLVMLLGALSLVMVAGPAVWAQDPIHKMRRGLANVLTGWLELPKYVQRGKQEDNPIAGIAGGLARGAFLTLLRAGTGLYETLTFPFPYPKDYASPYEQMELTDYAWE